MPSTLTQDLGLLKRIAAHAELINAVTVACTEALNAGTSREDVSAALARIQELLDQEEDD